MKERIKENPKVPKESLRKEKCLWEMWNPFERYQIMKPKNPLSVQYCTYELSDQPVLSSSERIVINQSKLKWDALWEIEGINSTLKVVQELDRWSGVIWHFREKE